MPNRDANYYCSKCMKTEKHTHSFKDGRHYYTCPRCGRYGEYIRMKKDDESKRIESWVMRKITL